MYTGLFFPYSWHLDDDETEVTCIRVYGLDDQNKNICLRIDNFTPYVYVELPNDITWSIPKAQLVVNKINDILGKQKPLSCCLQWKKKLYGAYLDENGERRKFPFLFCSFSSRSDIKTISYKLRSNHNVIGLGSLKFKVHESDADPILQLTCCRKIPTAGWIKYHGEEVHDDDKLTLCDHEYKVKWKNLHPYTSEAFPKPKIMGFDIEVNSTNPSAMPNAEKPGDKIFQISCVLARDGDLLENYENHILTLGDPDQTIVGENVFIHTFDSEALLLEGYTNFIREKNPNIIVGYNILGFDIPYMIARAKMNMCIFDFDKQGFHKYAHARERIIKWSSSAYKNQEFEFLDAEGRVYVDLLPLVKRDFKFNNYKLKTISEYFLGASKDPLTPKGIFKCYRIGMKRNDDGEYTNKAQKAMGIVAKYCVQDSVLVVRLMEKLKTWVGLTEMATVCNVPVFTLYTQGQQIKVFSQIYKWCMYEGIVVEKDGYQVGENERYMGAKVFPPIPGKYKMVVPFDFCFTGDTLITMANGCSKKINTLLSDSLVVSYEDSGLRNFSTINGLQIKGVKETIKLYLECGKVITCTPNHKFMLSNGEWKDASELKNCEVMCGIDYPEDLTCELEDSWSYTLNDYIFDMKHNREKSLAFARIIGYILSDGSIYVSKNKKCAEACFGTIIDAENFKRDVNMFSEIDIKIRLRNANNNNDRDIKGTTYLLNIPAIICKLIHSIDGIVIGKRSTQPMKLPEFILDDNCPKSIIREFLGGLYGGDGSAPYITKTDRFGSMSFKWTTIEKYKLDMIGVFEKLVILHEKLGTICNIISPSFVKYKKDSIRPKDYNINPRYDIVLLIHLDQIVNFSKNIGFRYCINKSCKLSIVTNYQLFCDKVRFQNEIVVKRTNYLIDTTIKNVFSRKSGNPTFKSCLEQAQNELLKNEPILHKYSLSSVKYIGYIRHEKIRHSDKQCKMSVIYKKDFPSPKEFIKKLGVEMWFSDYAVKTQDKYIPCYKQKIIDIRDNGFQEVYDIEVDKAHNFLANGVVAHNCSLYPTTIIAYNIDYHSWVPPDSDIPDSMCHVMEWQECISCIVEGTLISIGEYSVPIESLIYNKSEILSYNNGFLVYNKQSNFFDQGIKECIEITFEDKSTLQCTPDHKILLENNIWKEAQHIQLNSDKICCGYSPPFYNIKRPMLQIGELIFTNTQLVTFYKVLGYIYSAGGIDNISFTNKLDCKNMIRDLKKLHPHSVSIHSVNSISIIGKLGDIFLSLLHKESLPELLDDGEICAFLSGLYGGDNNSFSFGNKDGDAGSIRFCCENVCSFLYHKIQTYLLNCGIDSTITKHNKYLYIIPKDLRVFKEKIGFSYCIKKTIRLEVCYLYFKRKDIQHDYFPSPYEYIESLGQCIYGYNDELPIFYKKVIHVESIGRKKVYDIEVDKVHNFIANGVVVHNCMHDPKVIRKIDLTKYIDKEKEKIKQLREKRNKTLDKLRKKEIMEEIDKKVDELKPYIEERSEITKTINKNVTCTKRKYRFLKEPRGVLPTVIQNLLDARNHTRKVDMKKCKEEIDRLNKDTKDNGNDNTALIIAQKTLLDVLDKRQLAFKVSANSMYGAMGVRRGYLPFMPGAMCTTYMGRTNIEIVAKTIPEKYGGELIYGDTDSNYIHFPHLTTAHETWDYAIHVAEEISKLFPKPMDYCLVGNRWLLFWLSKIPKKNKQCNLLFDITI